MDRDIKIFAAAAMILLFIVVLIVVCMWAAAEYSRQQALQAAQDAWKQLPPYKPFP